MRLAACIAATREASCGCKSAGASSSAQHDAGSTWSAVYHPGRKLHASAASTAVAAAAALTSVQCGELLLPRSGGGTPACGEASAGSGRSLSSTCVQSGRQPGHAWLVESICLAEFVWHL